MERNSGCSLRALGGCLVIILGVFLCVGVTFVTIDQLCYDTLTNRLPMYPESDVLTQRHNLFRPFGMGETYIELYSADDRDTVQRWYGTTAGRYSREAVRTGDFKYRLANAQRAFVRADDGVGTFIQLYGACAQ